MTQWEQEFIWAERAWVRAIFKNYTPTEPYAVILLRRAEYAEDPEAYLDKLGEEDAFGC